jgi:hypothetical protein
MGGSASGGKRQTLKKPIAQTSPKPKTIFNSNFWILEFVLDLGFKI